MLKLNRVKTLLAAGLLTTAGWVGAASAATVTIDFESGILSGGTYTEDGFTFTSSSKGGVSLASDCGSDCLQFGNNEVITVVYSGGSFDVDGFLFRGPGRGGEIKVSDGVTPTILSESLSGNDMAPATFTTEYDGITSFTFQNAAKGSGRVDSISFTVAAIPVPAAGLLRTWRLDPVTPCHFITLVGAAAMRSVELGSGAGSLRV